MIDKCKSALERDKYGFWALEAKKNSEFLGFVALAKIQFECSFTGSIEIGWRLKTSAWGNGIASESARKLFEYGFLKLGLNEIVSLTAKVNQRSWKLMERIGMTRDPKDEFDHPKVDADSPLRSHVLYRLSRINWEKSQFVTTQ